MTYKIEKLLLQIKEKMGILIYEDLKQEFEQYDLVIDSLHKTIIQGLQNIKGEDKDE